MERSTLHTRREYHRNPQFGGDRPKPVVKGHDAVLKALQDSGRQATIVTLAGEKFVGKIVGRDKYTITLLVVEGSNAIRRVFYKHALEQFFGEEPQSQPQPQAS
jgi:sRNA-binding regulator protein Hfq